MLNEFKDDARVLKDAVLGSVHSILGSRKFTLAVAGFVAMLLHVPEVTLVPLVAAIAAEGAADIKSRGSVPLH